MASYKRGNTVVGASGLKTFTTGFQPIGYRLKFHLPGANNGYEVTGEGGTDGVAQTCSFNYNDGAGTIDSGGANNKVAFLHDDVGAGYTDVITGTHDSFNATNFKVNFSKFNASYHCDWEAWSA